MRRIGSSVRRYPNPFRLGPTSSASPPWRRTVVNCNPNCKSCCFTVGTDSSGSARSGARVCLTVYRIRAGYELYIVMQHQVTCLGGQRSLARVLSTHDRPACMQALSRPRGRARTRFLLRTSGWRAGFSQTNPRQTRLLPRTSGLRAGSSLQRI